ncbi:MAG: response regulator [Planctomycetes bacterium]|nr:response regulator [Planctomycetota bacterium]
MNNDEALVLVVDDELPIRRFLRTSLLGNGYRVVEAASAAEARARASTEPPDLVVLDLGLPDGDGLDVIDWLRGWSQAPILVLSARGQERDKVNALDRGADDYLTKPFGVGELLARLRVALRNRARSAAADETTTFRIGELEVDLVHRRVVLAGVAVALTPIEYRLLVLFVRHAGKVLTHGAILREVWGPDHSDDARYVRVFVASLRRKIEPEPARPRYLLTEQGVGYRLLESLG